MDKLTNYFEPLYGFPVLVLLCILIIWDLLGFSFRHRFLNLQTSEWRFLDWLIGFGLFIFVWFLIGHFVVPTKQNIILSLTSIGLFSGIYTLRSKRDEYLSFQWLSVGITLVFVAPYLKAVFIKASLPPYFSDEMAYHFLSIEELKNIKTWSYNSNVFNMIPKLLDTWYTLGFSLTHTQVLGRTLHFLIHFTSLVFAFHSLKKLVNAWTSILFLVLYLSLQQFFPFNTTIGYVDMANISFIIMGVVAALLWLNFKENSYFYLSAVFWGMGLGTKYTGLSLFLFFVILLVLNRVSKKLLIRSAGLFLIFGGYWYLKNLILTGNPVFPFLLPCYRWSEACTTGKSFFGTWTTPVTLENLVPIAKELTQNSNLLLIGIVFAFCAVFIVTKAQRKILLFPIILVILDMLLIKQISGFFFRYHQYMQFLILIFVSLGFSLGLMRIRPWAKVPLMSLIIAVSLINYKKTLATEYQESHLPKYERHYAYRKTDIYDFISHVFPKDSDFIKFCEHPTEGQPIQFFRVDPDLVWWGEGSQYARQYFTNCGFLGEPFAGLPLDYKENIDVSIQKAKEQELEFYVYSTSECLPQENVAIKRIYEDEQSLQMRKLNNMLICHSDKVFPGALYKFSYKKLLDNKL